MNTEEKFVHPDIQNLKTETSPNTLRARILTKLQVNEEKTTMRIRKNVARLSFSAIAIAAVVTGTMMMSNTASAVEKVHAAFQDAYRYHVKSFMVIGEKRTLTSETWVDGKNQKMELYDAEGKSLDIALTYADDLSKDAGEWIRTMPAQKIAKGEFLSAIFVGASKNLQPGKKGASDLIPVEGTYIIDTKSLAPGAEGTQKDRFIVDDQAGIWVAAPMVMGGQNGVEYLRKLLTDKELWNIEKGVLISGRKLDKYSLKEGLVRLELFVDPNTELPYLSRTRFGEGKQSVLIEDIYDYVTPVPTEENIKEGFKIDPPK